MCLGQSCRMPQKTCSGGSLLSSSQSSRRKTEQDLGELNQWSMQTLPLPSIPASLTWAGMHRLILDLPPSMPKAGRAAWHKLVQDLKSPIPLCSASQVRPKGPFYVDHRLIRMHWQAVLGTCNRRA